LVRSFQITNLFRGLTIYENLRLSLQARHPKRFNAWTDIDRLTDVHAETAELIRYLGLEGVEQTEAGALSYGGQRLVDQHHQGAVSGVRCAARPRSIIIVEHNLDLVLALADRVFALDRGAVIHQGPARPLLTDLAYRKQILWV
jgi:branched-chain amino acid transport system ATP-binding protein/branched-chain amino acid transport system permease protein